MNRNLRCCCPLYCWNKIDHSFYDCRQTRKRRKNYKLNSWFQWGVPVASSISFTGSVRPLWPEANITVVITTLNFHLVVNVIKGFFEVNSKIQNWNNWNNASQSHVPQNFYLKWIQEFSQFMWKFIGKLWPKGPVHAWAIFP